MRKLRIVLVSYACDPSRGTEPGLGWAWALALAQRGHTVDVLTRPDRENTRHIASHIASLGATGRRIRPHFIPVPEISRWVALVPGPVREQTREFLNYDGWQRRALRYARGRGLAEADLVHHVSYGSLVGGSALRELGPPLVFGPVGGGQTAPHSHRRFMGAGYQQEVLRELLWVRGLSHRIACRATLREAALVLTTNRDTALRARRLGCAAPRMLLADGIPEDLVCTSGDIAPGPTDRPTVLWVGRLTSFKAPRLALHTFSRLRGLVPEARMMFLGDGPLRTEMEHLASRLGVAESVCFRGRVPWDQALAAYDEAHVLLFTSLRDSSGVQTLEAWARGLPVVHLDHQGIGDFSAPGGAIPVPLGSPEDLPQRLAQALASVLTDAEARRRMKAAGRLWALRNTWTAKAELAEQLYRGILADSPPIRDRSMS
ncbi:glycosyltransferase family 4 protein [Streptomyces wuyuanensis]|uniref:glycosyltransferase family 4 protein n=1 Tax=Streptomyces wuyuanensis TaxID=1196353 RepID=UPI003D753C5F